MADDPFAWMGPRIQAAPAADRADTPAADPFAWMGPKIGVSRPETVTPRAEVPTRPAPERQHGDHAGDPDQHAQHRKKGPQLIVHDHAARLSEVFDKFINAVFLVF